jgi:insecticidal toxin
VQNINKLETVEVNFENVINLVDLQQALLPYEGFPVYEEVMRYYDACLERTGSSRLLEPVRLLRQTLEPLRQGKRSKRGVGSSTARADETEPNVSDIYDKVESFESLVQYSAGLVNTPATEVPRVVHFVWVGGGIGAIQRDYLNVWKQVLAEHGYTFNLWYDSDALLAYQTNKLIVEAAKADALNQVAGKTVSENELASLFEARAIVLKQQMAAHINAAVARGELADDARIDLLTRAYGQDANVLEALKSRNRESIEVQLGDGFQLRDLDGSDRLIQLQGIYEQETRLRGNLAAASDVVRAEVLYGEGGSYADVDNLPPLRKSIGDTDISAFTDPQRLGVLQLLLDKNPHWMPGRAAMRSSYGNHVDNIPQASRSALEAFAQSQPAMRQVFELPADRLVRPFAVRAVAQNSSINNAFLMAHPRAAMLQTIIGRIRFNYEVVNDAIRRAAQQRIALIDSTSMQPLAEEFIASRWGPLIDLSSERSISADYLAYSAARYFSDGIRPQSESTVYLSGPRAVRDGMDDFGRIHLTEHDGQILRDDASIAPRVSVNRVTEEELDHSWKENENDAVKWVSGEQERWQKGQYRTRYSGDMAELLKGSAIEFEQGWPLIEGRAVLLSSVLQGLIDGLGEPFIKAMQEQHSGVINFEAALPLSFGDRQLIKQQAHNALPPVFLGDARIQELGLDEVLVAMGNGELDVLHLTPLQRLSLGVLLGMDSLHSINFEKYSVELDNLVNSFHKLGVSSRYAAIERQLYQLKAPAFLSGLNFAAVESEASPASALSLKKAALMKAYTQQQWGRCAAQIQQVATKEHRLLVGEKLDQVLSEFDSEARSVKLVPQDLMLNGIGETIGGRCYPLALVMSAALTEGGLASHRLRERFYLAALEPQQSDSIAFGLALEELRGTALSEVGTPFGHADLKQVGAALESHTGTRTMMLNSENHSMLVAKTVVGNVATYHFYDPNFGLFEFESAAQLQRALEHFFVRQKMADYYAAYAGENGPRFDLVELHGDQISALHLSSGFEVAKLLGPDSLPKQPPGKIRQRLDSAHGRSLMENSHLGASLLGLDSHWWGQQIASATAALQELHTGVTPLVPLFETLQVTSQGHYQLSLVDPANPEHVVEVVSDDYRLLRIKHWLSEQFSTLARKPQQSAGVPDPTEAGSVHTLNAGFTIQALMNALRNREGDGRTLTMAVRLHAYLNYAQLLHGNVVDVVGLIRLVRTALNEVKIIARTTSSVVGEALGHTANEGVGAVLGLANVGFDIYQLGNAQDGVEQAQFGTQLAFDSASLALTAGGIGAALTGASTAAAVLGGAGVILGGLAVGVAALAQGFAVIARDAQGVGNFFADMEEAYRGVGYHFDSEFDAWIANPALIIKRIDLGAGTVSLDSPKLYPLRNHFGVADFDADYSRAIDIRSQLKLPDRIGFTPPVAQPIVLPCTPQTCYGYEYQALPFANLRHDRGFDTARRLEQKKPDGDWLFLFSFYSFPSHYIVRRLLPDYRDTLIEVQLDGIERTLVMPSLPDVWKGKLTYRITGSGNACALTLSRGGNVELHTQSLQASRWQLHATWANEADIRIEATSELYIGDVQVKLGEGAHEVMIGTADGQMFGIDWARRQLTILEQRAPFGLNEQALLEHYKSLAQEHRLTLAYTPIRDWLIPFESPHQPRYVRAWYDAQEDRFLYIRNERAGETDSAQLALVSGGFAWFCVPDSYDIWQVDAITGLLKNRYRLLLAEGKSTIGDLQADEQGTIHFVQTVVGATGTQLFGYLIHDGQLLLSSVTYEQNRELQAKVFADKTLKDWSVVLGTYLTPRAVSAVDGFSTLDWQPAPYVSVCWAFDPDKRDLVWVRSRDRLLIHPLPLPRHARGWHDSIKNLSDMVLLPMADESDLYFIYNRLDQTLCRLQMTAQEGLVQWSHRWVEPEGLKQVMAVENGYLVLDDEGRFFNLTMSGELQLGGVGEQWLKDHSHWWQALEPLARRYSMDSFAIIGLKNATGDGYLNAWYINDHLLLCDLGRDKSVRLLGVTPDNRSGWLFDLASGAIWSQELVEPQSLVDAFDEGAQLLHTDGLPTPGQDWADWRFAEVSIEGAGLTGTTVDGVSLRLSYLEPEVITGVSQDWVNAQHEPLVERLQTLLSDVDHETFVLVESAPGSLQWYDSQSARLIKLADKMLPTEPVLLGTQQRSNVLLHDRREGGLNVYPGRRSIGTFDYLERNAQVLTVEGSNRLDDLLPLIPDDVTTLILRMGQGHVTCRLSKAAWLKLDSLIIDCRHALGEVPAVPGKLIWDFDSPHKLLFEIVGEHLLIVDPDTEHSLIFRDVCSADSALRGEVYLAFKDQQSHAISTWVRRLQARTERSARVTMQTLLAKPYFAD